MPVKDARDRMTVQCFRGDHAKCMGRITVPNYAKGEHKEYPHQRIACACRTCKDLPSHYPVHESERRLK